MLRLPGTGRACLSEVHVNKSQAQLFSISVSFFKRIVIVCEKDSRKQEGSVVIEPEFCYSEAICRQLIFIWHWVEKYLYIWIRANLRMWLDVEIAQYITIYLPSRSSAFCTCVTLGSVTVLLCEFFTCFDRVVGVWKTFWHVGHVSGFLSQSFASKSRTYFSTFLDAPLYYNYRRSEQDKVSV